MGYSNVGVVTMNLGFLDTTLAEHVHKIWKG